MSSFYQRHWNEMIRKAPRAANFNADTMRRIATEGGPLWKYEQDPHNTKAFKEGFDRTFGKRDDIGSNLVCKEEKDG